MKNIKKLVLGLFVIALLVITTGCGEKNIEGKLEDLMEKVYKEVPSDNMPIGLMNIEVNDENIEGFLGTKDIEYEEALASESQVGAIAHSVVLIRVKDTKNIEDTKKKIKENIDPRKWICVGVEREEVIVENRGNLIIVIVAENNRDEIKKGFDNL